MALLAKLRVAAEMKGFNTDKGEPRYEDKDDKYCEFYMTENKCPDSLF
jgi:hypothetical protein